MKLHFEWTGIERLLEEINTAKTARTLYEEETGKGLWLVGDHGVYLMANTTDGKYNSNKQEDGKHFVVYANECNPDTMEFDDWWDNKRASFGGDDEVFFIGITEIEELVAKNGDTGNKPSSVCIDFGAEEATISVIWKILHSKKK